MNGGYGGNQNGAGRCRRDGKYKGEKKECARVSVEALCIFRFRELSPRFEEMGIQFGSRDRRRVSPGDTKHPIVGEATGWYLNPPTVTPYLLPSSSLSELLASLPQHACIYLCTTGNRRRGMKKRGIGRAESSSRTFARKRALLRNRRLAPLNARGWKKKRPRRMFSRVRKGCLKIFRRDEALD